MPIPTVTGCERSGGGWVLRLSGSGVKGLDALHVKPAAGGKPGTCSSNAQGWFWPPKISDTELSSNTARIACARIPATDSTRSLPEV